MKREQDEEHALKAKQMEELSKEREKLRVEQEEHEKRLKGKILTNSRKLMIK